MTLLLLLSLISTVSASCSYFFIKYRFFINISTLTYEKHYSSTEKLYVSFGFESVARLTEVSELVLREEKVGLVYPWHRLDVRAVEWQSCCSDLLFPLEFSRFPLHFGFRVG